MNYVIQQTPRSKEILVHVDKIKHLRGEDLQEVSNSKKKDLGAESSFDNFCGTQDNDGENREKDGGEFACSSNLLRRGAEPEKCDPDLPKLEPENVRVTRSKVKAGKACLLRDSIV